MFQNWTDNNAPQLQMRKQQCYNYFMKLKPCSVYNPKPNDYSACMDCYNFEKMTQAILKQISTNNTIGNMSCDNYSIEMDDDCECKECIACTDTLSAMKKSPLRLMKYLSCDNDRKCPNIRCVHRNNGSGCNNIDCGVYKIQQLFTSNKITIDDYIEIGFKQMINVPVTTKKGKTRNCHATIYEHYKWSDLKQIYFDELEQFMIHYNCWIHQHQTRRDFIDKTTGRIPNDTLVCHFDFINAIPIQYASMNSGNWGDQQKCSYFASCDRFKNTDDNIIEESAHYFCDNQKSS